MKKKVGIALILITAILVQGLSMPPNAVGANTKTMTIEFEESTSRSRTDTVIIPNLREVVEVSVNTGAVNHSVSGENVTINVSNGSYSSTIQTGGSPGDSKYVTGQLSSYYNDGVYSGSLSSYLYSGSYTPADSKTGTDTRTSSTNSFPSTISYSSGGYSGTLSKSGGSTSRVVSGSYTPADSKTASATQTRYEERLQTCLYVMGSWSWLPAGFNPAPTPPSSIPYNSGGYSGTLSYVRTTSSVYEASGSCSISRDGEERVGTRTTYTDTYSGTVTKPAVDTRVYEYTQNYSGTVTKPAVDTRVYRYQGTVYKPDTRTYAYYYKYTVTLKYIDNQEPILDVVLPSENSYYSKEIGHNQIFLNGTVKDNDESDVITVKYELGDTNGTILENLSSSNGQEYSFNDTVTIDDTMPDGEYTLKVIAEDDKGGRVVKSVNVRLDNTSPQNFTPTVAANGTDSIAVTGSTTDDGAGMHDVPYQFKFNDEEYTDWQADGGYTFEGLTPNTEYTFTMQARDKVENVRTSEEAKRYTHALDPTEIKIVGRTTDTITVKILNDDNNGNIPETKIRVTKTDEIEVALLDYSAETERVIGGLEVGVEYHIITQTRNSDETDRKTNGEINWSTLPIEDGGLGPIITMPPAPSLSYQDTSEQGFAVVIEPEELLENAQYVVKVYEKDGDDLTELNELETIVSTSDENWDNGRYVVRFEGLKPNAIYEVKVTTQWEN